MDAGPWSRDAERPAVRAAAERRHEEVHEEDAAGQGVVLGYCAGRSSMGGDGR